MKMPEEIEIAIRIEVCEHPEIISPGDLVTWSDRCWRVLRVRDDTVACLRSIEGSGSEKVPTGELQRPAARAGDRARSLLTGHHGSVVSAHGKWAQFIEDGEARETRTKTSNLFPVAKALR